MFHFFLYDHVLILTRESRFNRRIQCGQSNSENIKSLQQLDSLRVELAKEHVINVDCLPESLYPAQVSGKKHSQGSMHLNVLASTPVNLAANQLKFNLSFQWYIRFFFLLLENNDKASVTIRIENSSNRYKRYWYVYLCIYNKLNFRI